MPARPLWKSRFPKQIWPDCNIRTWLYPKQCLKQPVCSFWNIHEPVFFPGKRQEKWCNIPLFLAARQTFPVLCIQDTEMLCLGNATIKSQIVLLTILPPPVSWQLAEITAHFHLRKKYLERCLLASRSQTWKFTERAIVQTLERCFQMGIPHSFLLSLPWMDWLRHPVCISWLNCYTLQQQIHFALFATALPPAGR